MKTIRDFLCTKCGDTTERLVEQDVTHVPCDVCDGLAKRMIGMPRVTLDGCSGDFPSASDHWANIREQHAKVKAKKSWYER